MQVRFLVRCVLVLPLVAVLLSGCGRKPKPEPAPVSAETEEQQLFATIEQTFNEARVLLDGGQTNEALAKITAVTDDPRYARFRDNTLANLVQFLLYTGKIDDAKRLVAKVCVQDPDNANGALEAVHNYLMGNGGNAALLAWAADLASTPALSANIQRRILDWRLSAAVAQQDDEGVAALLAQAFRDFAPADGVALAAGVLDAHLSANRVDATRRVLAQVAAIQPQTPELAALAMTTRVRLTAACGDWAALPAAFASASAALPDAQLQGLMRRIVTLARKGGRYDVADALCEEILFKQPARTNLYALAAGSWAENAMTTNRVDLPKRLNAMLDAKVPASEVGVLFQRYYYDLIEQPALLKAMCVVGEKLLPKLTDKNILNPTKTMLLDGAFILEDFDAAITRLEAGIPDRDEGWHKMALAKVKAHRALKNKQPREAVQFFRDFMACVLTAKDEDTSDPATGTVHTKEMILGRNAKRIAEILAAIPDPEAAAKTFDEALGYYRKALEKANPEAKRIIEAEMAQLPKR